LKKRIWSSKNAQQIGPPDYYTILNLINATARKDSLSNGGIRFASFRSSFQDYEYGDLIGVRANVIIASDKGIVMVHYLPALRCVRKGIVTNL
jgi:hypothetical protein